MLGPTITGGKISLEPVEPDDLDTFIQWLNDSEVTRYLPTRSVPSFQQEQAWYEEAARSQDSVYWSIRAAGALIGITDLRHISWVDRHAGSGLMIGARSEWGKGYASEAVRLRTRFAFEELNLESLETESFSANESMHRALERCGYQKIGRKHRAIFRRGAWHDVDIFWLLREEWQARTLH